MATANEIKQAETNLTDALAEVAQQAEFLSNFRSKQAICEDIVKGEWKLKVDGLNEAAKTYLDAILAGPLEFGEKRVPPEGRQRMKTKLFEVRDRATFIPVMATLMADPDTDVEHWLLRRSGYALSDRLVVFAPLNGLNYATYDPHGHPTQARTLPEAHKYIAAKWDELRSGAVIDVEFILGETAVPKVSERLPIIDPPAEGSRCPDCSALLVIVGFCATCGWKE